MTPELGSVVMSRRAGTGRGRSPRDTLTRNRSSALGWGHEIVVGGFGDAQKIRSRGERPRPVPARLPRGLGGSECNAVMQGDEDLAAVITTLEYLARIRS